MYVEARKPKLRDLLCKQLNAVDRIAENDRLIDLELWMEEKLSTETFLTADSGACNSEGDARSCDRHTLLKRVLRQ